jgi:hypothetical protein
VDADELEDVVEPALLTCFAISEESAAPSGALSSRRVGTTPIRRRSASATWK